METLEIVGNSRFNVEVALKQKRAFNEKTAADLGAADLNLIAVLDIMEKSGLIAKTPEGKVFMTPKGLEQSDRGFKVNNFFPEKKFIRFSRNK